MSDTSASLQHKIHSAAQLASVVRTMKALAASNIAQYERAVQALDDYYLTVQLGLMACLRQEQSITSSRTAIGDETVIIVFGSDQGLVGQFNEVLVGATQTKLNELSEKGLVWVVGERLQVSFESIGLVPHALFPAPNAIYSVTSLMGYLLAKLDELQADHRLNQVIILHNKPKQGMLFEPINQRLLPLDRAWQRDLLAHSWPTERSPEVIGGATKTLSALIREYLFVSLFRACSESLASENSSRLAAMQRAEKNIDELLLDLNLNHHRLRQNSIDEELFDVISGFEALITH